MKHLIKFGAIIVAVFLLSCKKNISSENSSLAGKWKLLSDTSYVGAGAGNHAVTYIGKASDYFDFKPDGILFIEENGKLDVLSYDFKSDTTVTIDSFLSDTNGAPETCYITRLTINNVIVSTGIAPTPGGTFGRKVHLTR